MMYIFDDHDFGPNDADGNTVTREAATRTYLKYFPYYDLHTDLERSDQFTGFRNREEDYGIYRCITIGRVVLVVVDTRSFQRRNGSDLILGERQMSWLGKVMQQIKRSEWVKAVILVSSVNFNGDGNTWSEFKEERSKIADWLSDLQENYNKTVFIISSDSHMTAFFNGKGYWVEGLQQKYKRGVAEASCGSLDRSVIGCMLHWSRSLAKEDRSLTDLGWERIISRICG